MVKKLEDIQKDNDALLEENKKLKEELQSSLDSNSVNKEVEELKSENQSLKELNEKLSGELKDAHNMVSQVLREYSTKVNDPSFFNGDDGQNQEKKEIEDAQNKLSDFIKNI